MHTMCMFPACVKVLHQPVNVETKSSVLTGIKNVRSYSDLDYG